MEIKRIGSQPSNTGSSDWFTGTARIEPLFQAGAPVGMECVSVTFEPGAHTARQVPFCMFTDPEFARIGLSETEARGRGVAYRLAKMPMNHVFRAGTVSETRGFMKALIDEPDHVLGFTAFGWDAGEIMATVQVAMIAGLPYTALRDAIFTHPTMSEGLIQLFATVPPAPASLK